MQIKLYDQSGRILLKKEAIANFTKLKGSIPSTFVSAVTQPKYEAQELGEFICKVDDIVFTLHVLSYPYSHFVELLFYTAVHIVDGGIASTLTPEFNNKFKEYGFITTLYYHTPNSLENFIIKTVSEWKTRIEVDFRECYNL